MHESQIQRAHRLLAGCRAHQINEVHGETPVRDLAEAAWLYLSNRLEHEALDTLARLADGLIASGALACGLSLAHRVTADPRAQVRARFMAGVSVLGTVHALTHAPPALPTLQSVWALADQLPPSDDRLYGEARIAAVVAHHHLLSDHHPTDDRRCAVPRQRLEPLARRLRATLQRAGPQAPVDPYPRIVQAELAHLVGASDAADGEFALLAVRHPEKRRVSMALSRGYVLLAAGHLARALRSSAAAVQWAADAALKAQEIEAMRLHATVLARQGAAEEAARAAHRLQQRIGDMVLGLLARPATEWGDDRQLLARLATLRGVGDPGAAGSSDPLHLRRALALIDAGLASDISPKSLAEAVGVSRRSLEIAFRRFRGRSPAEHVRLRRLEEAHALLSGTELPIAEVRERVGYARASTFSADFRRHYGIQPTMARRRGLEDALAAGRPADEITRA